MNIYDRCPKGGALEIRGQQLARLQESINKELEHYQRLNDEKRVTTCASAMLAWFVKVYHKFILLNNLNLVAIHHFLG